MLNNNYHTNQLPLFILKQLAHNLIIQRTLPFISGHIKISYVLTSLILTFITFFTFLPSIIGSEIIFLNASKKNNLRNI